jgi:hypothetical protein
MGDWLAYDIHLMAGEYRARTGQRVTFVSPSSLRLVPSPDSPTGNLLYRAIGLDEEECLSRYTITYASEILERVYQVSLELVQVEFESFSPPLLRQIATCCVNDLRTIFLVHDKRFLGIILSELDHLVTRKVLNQQEAATISLCITPTILPRTPELATLITSCELDPKLKDAYILKAIRGGMGKEHILGDELDNTTWLQKLCGLRDADRSLEQNQYAIQRRIIQLEYDILRQNVKGRDVEIVEKFYLVSSYLTVNGGFVGSGPWRIGKRSHLGAADQGIATFAFTDR